jgi:hypothetical protein
MKYYTTTNEMDSINRKKSQLLESNRPNFSAIST